LAIINFEANGALIKTLRKSIIDLSDNMYKGSISPISITVSYLIKKTKVKYFRDESLIHLYRRFNKLLKFLYELFILSNEELPQNPKTPNL
jgi:hypothetical protein